MHKGRPWLLFAIITTAFWGIWGALIEIPEKSGFPATLGYTVWALTMVIPSLIALGLIREERTAIQQVSELFVWKVSQVPGDPPVSLDPKALGHVPEKYAPGIGWGDVGVTDQGSLNVHRIME